MAITHAPVGSNEEGDEHHSHEPQGPQQPQPAHPPHPLHQHSFSNASTASLDIESWVVGSLQHLNVAPIARGTGNALSIPLDGDHNADNGASAHMRLRGVAFGGTADAAQGLSIAPPRRPPSRRDSMRKRDALLKGKEGSRQRRRYENGNTPLLPSLNLSTQSLEPLRADVR